MFDWPIVFQYDVKVTYRLISGKFSGIKNALYLSVKVFSTKVLIGETTFTSPTGDGTPFYMVIRATRVQRDYVHFPSIVPAQGIEPATFRSAVKRSTTKL